MGSLVVPTNNLCSFARDPFCLGLCLAGQSHEIELFGDPGVHPPEINQSIDAYCLPRKTSV